MNGHPWLFVADWVCPNKMRVGYLTSFLEDIPFMMRGLIHIDNAELISALTNRKFNKRGWDTKALLVESPPLKYT